MNNMRIIIDQMPDDRLDFKSCFELQKINPKIYNVYKLLEHEKECGSDLREENNNYCCHKCQCVYPK